MQIRQFELNAFNKNIYNLNSVAVGNMAQYESKLPEAAEMLRV
jgi:hypothetical protein